MPIVPLLKKSSQSKQGLSYFMFFWKNSWHFFLICSQMFLYCWNNSVITRFFKMLFAYLYWIKPLPSTVYFMKFIGLAFWSASWCVSWQRSLHHFLLKPNINYLFLENAMRFLNLAFANWLGLSNSSLAQQHNINFQSLGLDETIDRPIFALALPENCSNH